MAVQNLGPWSGVYNPGYQLLVYSNGNPSKPVRGVDWNSITQIQTSKTLDDVAGTFTITMKDARARARCGPMDVVKIRLRGHNQGRGVVLVGVVDYVGPSESAQLTSAQQDTVISGRCTAKYLQVNSMFLPVWDPLANLPTALTFGVGDASQKVGTNVSATTPRGIFGYIFDHFVVGLRNRVGLSGIPNARFWMNRRRRFEWVTAANGKLFQVPFVQFDEDTTDTALTRLSVQGFTEGWVDEVGNVVYRHPQWDAPASYRLHTSGLLSDTLQDGDIGMATYVEVFPGALPALPSGVAQAMLAGRAPIPSDYVTGLRRAGFRSPASPQFIIDTDARGKPTADGLKNWYYQKQKKFGLRPYQITSPLLASREQAQAQAEGLLRFMLRWTKGGTVTIPGEPGVKLGTTLYLWGSLRGQKITRTYYVEGVAHEYVENDHYTTTLTLSHGRDPGDPSWQQMVLPNFDPSQLTEASGILSPPSGGHGGASLTLGTAISGFANPFPGGWQPGRLDLGYDGTFARKLDAPFSGQITFASSSFSNWGGYIQIKADGPIPGLPSDTLYFAEGVAPIVTAGQYVNAGQQIGVASAAAGAAQGVGAGTIEWGVAAPGSVGTPTDPLAETGISNPRAMVLAFAQWAHATLGVAKPASTSNAGYP